MFRCAGITKKGFEILGEALSGKTLTFTRMEYGSGILPGLESIVADTETLEKYNEFIKTNPEPTEQQILEMLRTEETDLATKSLILDAESLVSKKGDIGMYEVVSADGVSTLTGKVVDSSVSVDFRARELGVFAQVADGEEVLFAYFSAVDYLSGEMRDSSDFISIPALLGQEQIIKVNIATGQAANIDMKYNLEIYATKKEFDETVAKIKEQIAVEVANIIAEAPESFDTLKEISDWITTHEDSAAAMNSAILENKEAIAKKADSGHTHTKSEITDFPSSLPANGGNAATATKLQTARAINGTSFDGSGAITTAKWGTARSGYIADSDGSNTGSAVSVDGSGNFTLKLPSTIKASITGNCSGSSGSCTGNAATATKATNDGSGNNIVNTYQKKSDVAQTAFNACYPIGCVYVQYPKQKSPNDLWGSYSTWTVIDYSGAFFRAQGGNANSFIEESGVLSKQAEGLPNISGTIAHVTFDDTGNIATGPFTLETYPGGNTISGNGNRQFVYFDASRCSSIYGNGSHVTPENYTVRVWKRTA